MKKFNTLGVVGLLSLAAVGCGGEYTPEEEQAMQQPELGDVAQAAEYATIDAMQTRDFSTWLFGSTPFIIENLSSTHSTPYYAYCGGNSTSGTIAAGATITGSLMCNWPGSRLYVRNNGTLTGNQRLYVTTY
ncbi:hypothetical protein HV824_05505 [Myxococcus sp. AM009]|uniref:hypothetical protein n=1 Tax=unclassified Myxococcus TaxID=2648731 RepID=UPI001595325E|nr:MULTISPECIES: hypothetical protein [unclassified Myxococcus]NVI97573.1 hypothetical protein [Myxococcus sp. AM009]NVJ15489.1 hypothetical protein [Myxococcus sp. AM010]